MSESDDTDGYVRRETYSLTRRPRKERYFHAAPIEEMSHDWLVSVVGMIEVVLDHTGAISLQDVADAIDYGPHQLSPRQAHEFQKVAAAFKRSMSEQAEKCQRGEHLWRGNRCWACKESILKVVEEENNG